MGSFTSRTSGGCKAAATRVPTDTPGPGCGSANSSRVGVAPDRRTTAARILLLRWMIVLPCDDVLCGDAFCVGELRRQELSGSVQRRDRFVEDGMKGLEDVRHAGGEVEGDLDVGGGGLPRQADGVVEENLVRSTLDDQGRQAGQVGEDGADEA